MKKTGLLLLIALMLLGGCVQRSYDEAPDTEQSAEEASQASQPEWSDRERPPFDIASANNRRKEQAEITLVQLSEPVAGEPAAVLRTSEGDVTIRLFPQYAPLAVENFAALAEENFYNGKLFYYVNRESVIQSGAVNANGTGSRSALTNEMGEEWHFPVETGWDLWHFRGAVSLVPDSGGDNGSQFMITAATRIYGNDEEELEQAGYPAKVRTAYGALGGIPFNDGYQTVFGMVVDGMEVVGQIAALETDSSGAPLKPVVIEWVQVGTLGEDIPLPQPAADAQDSGNLTDSAAA